MFFFYSSQYYTVKCFLCYRFVGVVTMDIDLKKIDFNACGISDGNPGPSYMAGVNRCKPNTGVRLFF